MLSLLALRFHGPFFLSLDDDQNLPTFDSTCPAPRAWWSAEIASNRLRPKRITSSRSAYPCEKIAQCYLLSFLLVRTGQLLYTPCPASEHYAIGTFLPIHANYHLLMFVTACLPECKDGRTDSHSLLAGSVDSPKNKCCSYDLLGRLGKPTSITFRDNVHTVRFIALQTLVQTPRIPHSSINRGFKQLCWQTCMFLK